MKHSSIRRSLSSSFAAVAIATTAFAGLAATWMGAGLVAAQGTQTPPAEPSPLTRALLARYPEHEIVPQSCVGAPRLQASDRLCLTDERTGLARVVRRVALGGSTAAALRGTEVFFAVGDPGGVRTRFTDRVWRWDLARDVYLGLGNAPTDWPIAVVDTSFGILYRLRAGWFLNDAAGGRQVSAPEDMPERVEVAGGATFFASGTPITVRAVELDGARVRFRPHATMPGERLYYSHHPVVLSVETRAGAVQVHLLRLPSAQSVAIAYPTGSRAPNYATRIDDHRIQLSAGGTAHAVLDLTAGTITAGAIEVPAAASRPPSLRASSLVRVLPTASGGVFIGRDVRGWSLGATGAVVQRRSPRAARGRCHCTLTALTCARGSAPVPDACTETPELDRITDAYADTSTGRVREILYTDDGRFRLDRLEADHVRVTRLSDGARLWARMFEDDLFVQADDGTYFTSDRALTARMAIRSGRALLTAPIAPLTPRADELFRPDLVRDFFAAPAAAQ